MCACVYERETECMLVCAYVYNRELGANIQCKPTGCVSRDTYNYIEVEKKFLSPFDTQTHTQTHAKEETCNLGTGLLE